jgi:hypothetical protein
MLAHYVGRHTTRFVDYGFVFAGLLCLIEGYIRLVSPSGEANSVHFIVFLSFSAGMTAF